jgi:hypothetical protein
MLEEVAKVPRFAELGAMPTDDPLAMNAWIHRALGVSAAQTVADPDLTDSQRRAQLCDIASRMAALTPQSRIFGAEQLVRADAAGVDPLRGEGPKMEEVPADAAPVAIAAASSRGKTFRGRPRKRGLS